LVRSDENVRGLGSGRTTGAKVGRVALAVVLAVLTIRIGVEAVRFGVESVQQDFASYYVAGQAVGRGLSPFDNHVDAEPPLWDGVAVYRHSRFMYLPIVAWAFFPLTWLPYAAAKFLWMVLALAALAAALWQAARAADLRLDATNGAVLAVIATAYFPVLALLERGQIDSVTLAILMVAVCWLSKGRRELPAGVLLACATAIKLYGIFLLPFLAARKRWRGVTGFFAGAAGILLVSLLVHGPGPLRRYVSEELPRISRYGDRGPQDSRLAPSELRPLLAGVPPGRTALQGRTYAIEALAFEINASAVRTPVGRAVWNAARGLGVPIAPAQVSLVFLAVGLAVVLAWQRWAGPPRDRLAEFAYWNVVLILILLCAPLTWSMATVWLLPTAVVVVKGFRDSPGRKELPPLVLCAAGLAVAGLGDPALAVLSSPVKSTYVVAELLCVAGLLGLWRARCAG
jgi:hypothetical protein